MCFNGVTLIKTECELQQVEDDVLLSRPKNQMFYDKQSLDFSLKYVVCHFLYSLQLFIE